jgi:hypothetical protein
MTGATDAIRLRGIDSYSMFAVLRKPLLQKRCWIPVSRARRRRWQESGTRVGAAPGRARAAAVRGLVTACVTSPQSGNRNTCEDGDAECGSKIGNRRRAGSD